MSRTTYRQFTGKTFSHETRRFTATDMRDGRVLTTEQQTLGKARAAFRAMLGGWTGFVVHVEQPHVVVKAGAA